jgi:hypothetical protein
MDRQIILIFMLNADVMEIEAESARERSKNRDISTAAKTEKEDCVKKDLALENMDANGYTCANEYLQAYTHPISTYMQRSEWRGCCAEIFLVPRQAQLRELLLM